MGNTNEDILSAPEEKEDVEAEEEKHDETMEKRMESRIKQANEKLKQISGLIASASDKDLIKVALRLPDGKRHTHTFCNENTIESVFDFANTFKMKNDDAYIEEFELVCSFPKRVFTKNDAKKTLKTCNIERSCLMFVQEVVSE